MGPASQSISLLLPHRLLPYHSAACLLPPIGGKHGEDWVSGPMREEPVVVAREAELLAFVATARTEGAHRAKKPDDDAATSTNRAKPLSDWRTPGRGEIRRRGVARVRPAGMTRVDGHGERIR